jgi:hypothetical protein
MGNSAAGTHHYGVFKQSTAWLRFQGSHPNRAQNRNTSVKKTVE